MDVTCPTRISVHCVDDPVPHSSAFMPAAQGGESVKGHMHMDV